MCSSIEFQIMIVMVYPKGLVSLLSKVNLSVQGVVKYNLTGSGNFHVVQL